MLLAAVVDDSDSVFVDLLTYADLEALKSKRAGAPPRAAPSSKTNNKRYLILTYAAEFDRVHYPLPLLHEDAPSADALRATIARLKRENAKLAAGVVDGDGGFVPAETASEGLKIIGEENAKLREENDALRAQARQLQRELARATTDAAANGGAALSLRGSTEFESRGAGSGAGAGSGSEREEHLRAELKAVTTELRLMRRERDDANRAAQAAQTDASNAESSKRRMLARKQKELDAAVADVSKRRETERELRVKVKDLSTQCDGLERRLRASGVSAYHSRPSSRAPSPGRVGYGAASPRGDRPRPWRESPAGSRAATPSRARGDRTPTPRDSTGFRTPTHARSPSPAARGRSPTPRAAAASPGRRFDPTAYVREKQQRDEARFRNSARGIASGASTPRAAASPARERPGYGARGGGPGARGVRSPSPSAGRGDGGARLSAGTGADRRGGESPGRVLRDVKNKLADLASREGGDAGAGAGAGGAKRAAGAGKPAASGKDASAEIADIDSRLAALQNFLKEAKSGAAGAAGGVTA
jgi:coiled-coil domain-containing protein 61